MFPPLTHYNSVNMNGGQILMMFSSNDAMDLDSDSTFVSNEE
ncbi:MAG: hypothetical protein ACI8RD_012469 [Bacillariaceae sp.]|jgi:hypothetical protein